MDHGGINIHGIRSCIVTRVTLNNETFEECIQMMRTQKNELADVKEAQRQGYVVETLEHSDEEFEDGEGQEEEELDELEDRLFKSLSYMRGKDKMDMPTYLGSPTHRN